MTWYFAALKKYAVFRGRSRRKEFWYFVLFNFLIFGALVVIDLKTNIIDTHGGPGIFSSIFFWVILIPSIAASVRRLHDTNHSGWLLLIIFIPLIGWVALLQFMARPGDLTANPYGENPGHIPDPNAYPSLVRL